MGDRPGAPGGAPPAKSSKTVMLVIAAVVVVVVFGGCCSISGALYLMRLPSAPPSTPQGGDLEALEAAQGLLSPMEIMEGGQWIGRLDPDGSIWRNSQHVGTIDGDGHVSGSVQGRIDPSSGFITEGSQVGRVGEDGDLFNPTNVGYIAEDGNIFFGTHWGQVQGYGDTPMDRAAVTAYLHFFARAF